MGKHLLASLLHYLGPHPEEPLFRIDCATLPPELLAHELFGTAHNGDVTACPKPGRLELAGSGTVVLDEVAALSMPMQAKLLRVMEGGEFDRSSESPIRVHARIVALTNVNLERAVARRSFREDLYYRLNVAPLMVRPLRERPADILPLAEHFLLQLSQVHRRAKPILAEDAAHALQNFSYPGNVQQLRNLMEHVVVSSTSPEVHEAELPPFMRQAKGRPLTTLEDLERDYIADVLTATQGKKSRAAQILGISRKTLLEKRKRYGLE